MSSNLKPVLEIISRNLSNVSERTINDVDEFCSVTSLKKDTVYELLSINEQSPVSHLNSAGLETFTRVVQIYRATLILFEDIQDAATWVLQPACALRGRPPLSCALMESQTQEAIQFIGRLEHGVPN